MLDLDTGESRVLVEFEEYETAWTVSYSADGEQLVLSLHAFEPQEEAALMLVERSTGAIRTVARQRDTRFAYVTWRPTDGEDCGSAPD